MGQRITHLVLLSILVLILGACRVATDGEPPATLQAAAAGTTHLTDVDLDGVDVLLEKPFGSGQLILYQWHDARNAQCLATAYLTPINNEWRTHDTATTECRADAPFMAAYTGNSELETPFGPPRHTTAYGTSTYGQAVRVVWVDGQVSHIPLENGAFLATRSGRWAIERIELLDQNNNLLLAEEWGVANAQLN